MSEVSFESTVVFESKYMRLTRKTRNGKRRYYLFFRDPIKRLETKDGRSVYVINEPEAIELMHTLEQAVPIKSMFRNQPNIPLGIDPIDDFS